MHQETDEFSERNDPYEYVLTTAAGAARINDRPAESASFLLAELPDELVAGQTVLARFLIRNEGNTRWANPDGYALSVSLAGQEIQRIPLEDGFGNAPVSHRGIVRGEPV